MACTYRMYAHAYKVDSAEGDENPDNDGTSYPTRTMNWDVKSINQLSCESLLSIAALL